ncbi:hypothetical protein LguiA_003596 [Lonicera macranthoides]
MADQHSFEGSSTSNVSAESSESTVELNIKTLDSEIHSFHVDKNMLVSVFKEKIASQIGVPVGQQRLIFRGKVLKDDHPLSEYHVENGHTLHLVVRQPSQPQPSSGTGTGETNANTAGIGQEASAGGGSRPRVGQVSHSVVLGTFNVGEQGEGVVPDLSRVIGAVLNSFGIGNQTVVGGGPQPNVQVNASAQAPQGNETEGRQGNVGDQRQAGNQPHPGLAFSGQSIPQVMQIPIGAAIPVPSLNMPIPDSLSTLSEFMNRMELTLSHNGYQPNQPVDLPTVELPSNARSVPTAAALSVVLRHAQRLLGGHAVAALSHIAGQLEQEGSSTDSVVRNQIQTGSMQVGLAMQHLGALLLELGRTMLTLRMGRSTDESHVNAGPAVYISPSGPNPIMVQPFPLQTSPLFGGHATPPLNPGPFGPVGVGSVPRHVNIHIHTAVGPRTTNGERVNGAVAGDSGQTRVLPVRNVVAAAVPSRPSAASVSNAAEQPAVSVPPQAPESVPLSTVVAEDNLGQSESSTVPSQFVEHGSGNEELSNSLRNLLGIGVGETSISSRGSAFGMEGQMKQSEGDDSINKEDFGGATSIKDIPASSSARVAEIAPKPVDDAARSSQGSYHPEGAAAIPLGLGLGGLQPKRRSRQLRPQGTSGDGGTLNAPTNQNQDGTQGREILQSLASLANRRNENALPAGHLPPGVVESIPSSGRHGGDGQFDPSSNTSQANNAAALNGLLAGVSQQTGIGSPDFFRNMLGQLTQSPVVMNTINQIAQQIDGQDIGNTEVGSPDVLRNMLGQLTQSPAMMNTVNQIAQQLDSQDLGNTFSGLGRGGHGGGGGGIDLSRMIQQMMPIFTQAVGGGGSTLPQAAPAVQELQPLQNERWTSRDDQTNDQTSQVPAMMNTVNQIAQQLDSQDLGNMFSGLGRGGQGGGGGGIDLSRMIQQMMPIFTQAVGGGGSTLPQAAPAVQELQPLHNERWTNRDDQTNDQTSQVDLKQVAERIEQQDPPVEIFRSAVESAVHLYNNTIDEEGLVDILCSEEGLASEFMEMTRRDISRRLEEETGSVQEK